MITSTSTVDSDCPPQVADGLIELWKGASGLQCCKEKIGLQKLLAKYKMPLSASKTGADCLPGVNLLLSLLLAACLLFFHHCQSL